MTQYLWNHDIHLFDSCTTSPILASDYDRVAAAIHRLREIPEMAIGTYVGHLFAIDDQRGARLGAADHLHDVAVQFRVVHFEQHFLLFTCNDKREFKRIALVAYVVFLIDRAHSPEIIAGR